MVKTIYYILRNFCSSTNVILLNIIKGFIVCLFSSMSAAPTTWRCHFVHTSGFSFLSLIKVDNCKIFTPISIAYSTNKTTDFHDILRRNVRSRRLERKASSISTWREDEDRKLTSRLRGIDGAETNSLNLCQLSVTFLVFT